jgi:hypothetical protein
MSDADTRQVLEHHVQAILDGDLDAVMQDYAEEAVLMTPFEVYRGPDEIRRFFRLGLENDVQPDFSDFVMMTSEVSGELAYHVMYAEPWLKVGTDTFVVRDGKILYQTAAGYAEGPGLEYSARTVIPDSPR